MSEFAPFETLREIAGGYCLSRCLHVIADLGIADLLDDAPRTATDLAASAKVHPDALGRFLRLLAAHSVFEMQGDTVRHSPASRLLRTDHPQSMRPFVRMIGSPLNWTIYAALEHSVRTGLPATAKVVPEGLWAYRAHHPEEARLFDEAMAAKAHGDVAAIIAAYDFSAFGSVADIGGGRGHLVQAVLDAAPAKGVLFDLPYVIEAAAGMASERLTLLAGDFFRDALPSCDAYLLMEVIHDWGDDEAAAILTAIRRAAPAHAKLLLIEQMLPTAPGPTWTELLDMHMLTLLGGRQRTRRQYEALLDQAGFVLHREIDTRADVSILEAGTA